MPSFCDYSPAASEHIGEQVPREILNFLKANDTPKLDEAKLGSWIYWRWHDNGSKITGTWEEVFYSSYDQDSLKISTGRKVMGIYYTGKYIEIVVRKAKEALNIPMYANAWVGASPCDSEFMDIFHIGCPSLDGMGPDNPGDILYKYVRPWNMLVEPEFSGPENYFRALSLGALLNGCYFADEVEIQPRAPLNAVVRAMEPALVTKRNPGDLFALSRGKKSYQNLEVQCTSTGRGGSERTAQTVGPILGPNGLIVRMGPDE